MIVIPQQDIETGQTVEFEGKTYKADAHFSQGKDLKDKPYTHIMFTNKGAYGMVEV